MFEQKREAAPENDAVPAPQPAPDLSPWNDLLAAGTPTVEAVRALCDAHPSQKGDILAQVAGTLGNAFVSQVLAAPGAATAIPGITPAPRDPADQVTDAIAEILIADLDQLDASLGNVAGSDVMVNVPGVGVLKVPLSAIPFIRETSIRRRISLNLENLHRDRQQFAKALDTVEQDQRHALMVQVRAIDKPYVDEIRRLQAGKPERYEVGVSLAAQSSFVAAQQLAAVMHAEEMMQDPAKAKADSVAASTLQPGEDWCGGFVAAAYGPLLDKDLAAAFASTIKIEDLMTYGSAFPLINPRWIWTGQSWMSVQDYHLIRGSLRGWTDATHAANVEALDLRPGDVVEIDYKGQPLADHIAMVHSFDRKTQRLYLVEGNANGYVIDQSGAAPAGGEAARVSAEAGRPMKAGGVSTVTMEEENLADKTQRWRIYGIGRPSVVDLEEHKYSSAPVMPTRPPP